METTSRYHKRNPLKDPLLRFSRLWGYLINTGIDTDMPLWNKKRIRLLNGICVMGFLAQFWFVCSYTAPREKIVFWEAFQSMIFYLVIILLNKAGKYTLTCHLFCTYNLLCYSFFAIAHGKVDGAEYFLLPSGMAALLFFKKQRVILTYLLLNFLFFWVCKYSFTVMKPLLVLPFNTYVPNQIFLFVVSFLIVVYFKTENLRQEKLLNNQNLKLAEEKEKSEALLLNILPQETAEELKATGAAKPKFFETVTVMFTDFHNFTHMAAQMHPEELVSEIHFCFSTFDGIMNRHNMEKIKTIGDAYMCVGGVPVKNERHAENALLAALEIREFIAKRKEEKILGGQPYFDIRIGIHSGPVVAGVVGTKKFAYDIWGDTVNVASRMESSGEEGKINISQETYELVKEKFHCIYRGKISAKNKGLIDMFFVEHRLPQPAVEATE